MAFNGGAIGGGLFGGAHSGPSMTGGPSGGGCYFWHVVESGGKGHEEINVNDLQNFRKNDACFAHPTLCGQFWRF